MSKSKSSRKHSRSPASPQHGRRQNSGKASPVPSAPPTVSGRWLLSAIGAVAVAALFCAWGTLCILFWQGSWQLLYHPASAVTRTPASVNLPFDSVGFDTTPTGQPLLRGWWIPAASPARFTAIYLHGETGNLGDTIPALLPLHAARLNLFAIDYRGYGQSHFIHPNETRWREDADAAIAYLTNTRHIPMSSIILVGHGLGANLALETAAAHPDLAGIILEQPLNSPTSAIFSDARAKLVPARLLVRDRWDTDAAASNLLIPSLWFYWAPAQKPAAQNQAPLAYQNVSARKMLVSLMQSSDEGKQFSAALSEWLDQLQSAAK